jgi:hypothetical protein
MPAPPLTHHDILGLVEPFARRGHHVDLAASDRIERQLVFKPREHAASADHPALRETLKLDCFATGGLRLTRSVARIDGVQATLQAVGNDGAALLARIDAVPLARHFQSGAGYTIARSFEFESAGESSATPTRPPFLSRGAVHADGLVLTFDIPAMRSGAAEIMLRANAAARPVLPDDLLGVIGWDWARLVPHPDGWTSRLRLRGGRARRSAIAERAIERAAEHLAQVLAEPPRRYHERHLLARWGFVLRRMIPTLTTAAMLVGAFLLTQQPRSESNGMWLALHYVSIGLLAFSFCLQELPRFEIAPWPRRARLPAWRDAPAVSDHAQGDECSATR